MNWKLYDHVYSDLGVTNYVMPLISIGQKKASSFAKRITVTPKSIFKFLIILVLMIFFYTFYFRLQYKHYSEKLTNTAKYDQRLTENEPPAITICFDPKFKKSVFRKYDQPEYNIYVDDSLFFGNLYPQYDNQTMNPVFENESIKVKL